MMRLQRSHIASGGRVPVHVDSTQRRSSKTLRRVRCMVYSFKVSAGGAEKVERTNVCIIGSGPAAHTAGIYAGRASLNPIMFEGFMAGGVAPGGQLTTTDILENFPGLADDTSGLDFCDRIREQSEGFGTKIYTETVTKVDFSVHPLRVYTDYREVHAQTVVVATGATARRLRFPGSEEFWNRGISVCAVCDGSLPAFRGKPIGVVGGGDSAMTEALFMTKYGCKVYVIHRFDYFEASRFLASKVLQHPNIEVIWESEVVEGYGDDWLEGVQLRSNASGEVSTLPLNGLFFAIGHTPNTAFLGGQLQLDKGGFIVTAPDSAATSVPGVFAAGDVQDSVFRQAVTSAGTGCMAAMESEWFISQNELLLPEADGAPTLRPAPGRQVQLK